MVGTLEREKSTRMSGTASPGGCVSNARKVDVRLPGKGDLSSHGARPIRLIITMIKWIRTNKELSRWNLGEGEVDEEVGDTVAGRVCFIHTEVPRS